MKISYYSLKKGPIEITLEERASYCNRGRYYAKLFQRGGEHIDDLHGWPRYFFNRQHAFDELEDWMRSNWHDAQVLTWEKVEEEV